MQIYHTLFLVKNTKFNSLSIKELYALVDTA